MGRCQIAFQLVSGQVLLSRDGWPKLWPNPDPENADHCGGCGCHASYHAESTSEDGQAGPVNSQPPLSTPAPDVHAVGSEPTPDGRQIPDGSKPDQETAGTNEGAGMFGGAWAKKLEGLRKDYPEEIYGRVFLSANERSKGMFDIVCAVCDKPFSTGKSNAFGNFGRHLQSKQHQRLREEQKQSTTEKSQNVLPNGAHADPSNNQVVEEQEIERNGDEDAEHNLEDDPSSSREGRRNEPGKVCVLLSFLLRKTALSFYGEFFCNVCLCLSYECQKP